MSPQQKHYVTTFYSFKRLENPEQVQTDLENKAEELSVKGLIIIGHEGFNATTVATSEVNFAAWKTWVTTYFQLPNLFFKDSESDKAPFRRFKVKIREEIVTAGVPDMTPPEGLNHHLSPQEWDRVLKEEKDDIVVIDTRNWYEYKIGTFKGALNPNIEKFTDFPKYIESQGISKDKKMLIFCTGGIRCEKGILELQKQGYDEVYQLDGGILNYLKEKPNEEFEGECFVFDHRVAVDQNLQPSTKYGLCPHCGQPSDVKINCARCDSEELICVDCQKIEFKQSTCSKNCAYQFEMHPGVKAPKQLVPFQLEKIKAAKGEAAGKLSLQITKTKKIEI